MVLVGRWREGSRKPSTKWVFTILDNRYGGVAVA